MRKCSRTASSSNVGFTPSFEPPGGLDPQGFESIDPGAIVRKAKLMRRIPQKEQSMYPFIALSVEEYTSYIERAAELIAGSIRPGSVDYTFRFG